jgi:hypothetical protein
MKKSKVKDKVTNYARGWFAFKKIQMLYLIFACENMWTVCFILVGILFQ